MLICGDLPTGDAALELVAPLRSTRLRNSAPIVLLSSKPPDEVTWRMLEHFQDIYFVKGSAGEEEDLLRCNVEEAKKAIVLAKNL